MKVYETQQVEMNQVTQNMEQERDFYYEKLRKVEQMCEPFDQQMYEEADEDTKQIYRMFLTVFYNLSVFHQNRLID